MKKLNKVTHLIPLFLLWATLAVIFWGWVFSLVTDTTPDKKLTLFADTVISDDISLALLLEKDAPPHIKMAKAHEFEYAMLDSSSIRNADLYIAKAGFADQYADWIAPLPDGIFDGYTLLKKDALNYGILVYDAETDVGAASDFISYTQSGAPSENYYLFLSASSLHLETNPSSLDNEAVNAAMRLLKTIPAGEKQ